MFIFAGGRNLQRVLFLSQIIAGGLLALPGRLMVWKIGPRPDSFPFQHKGFEAGCDLLTSKATDSRSNYWTIQKAISLEFSSF